MSTDTGPAVQELLPTQAWDLLEREPNAVLVDVRTKAEWSFVGKPDLSSLNRSVIMIEWSRYPDMSVNPRFVEEMNEALGDSKPSQVLFICRSGARSMSAALSFQASLAGEALGPDLFNVTEGFEGDLDPSKHRGGLNGWKAHGLPWRQS
ncbi:Rhodanese-related sulfurtransferase [Litoreibacter ascidiaceicola]|uniref:Rhodanese-related sulfurtransferase n=1 Tax=Litoreibacter ascidiaceicola TaxID=1486859 RepID=A0A1M5ATI8_9RHOB|nr:rhodanese-like domain-containing protein [Litoreibacter ascidiaceicola]SHF33456.1 Rhodanese-related sulfurtransferase [Litoreibacter ascidiaceicola]